jgi:exodeoxyribonuclease VII large subunit
MSGLDARLSIALRPALGAARGSFGTLAARLSALSPLSILARGYAIAIHAESGRALLSASEARAGDRLDVRLHEGHLSVRVEET